ncbi:MAG: hypothetical protein KDJ65_26435 [Anaerolineae bacterium]|nr:hypothetical protein [Anaerolineae bacterium]
MNGRLIIIVIALIVGLALLTLVCFVTLYLAPNLAFNPLSPARATANAATRIAKIPTATATEIPISTYPPTWTPSATFTPGPTKTTTETRTATPTRTSTATDTATATRTFTPVPPTSTPTDTATPTPFPYFVIAHSGMNNCSDLGLWAMINDDQGLPQGGITIQYGEYGVSGSRFLSTSDPNGRIDALLIPGSNRAQTTITHTWYAFVVADGQQQSETFLFETDPIFANNPDICDKYDPNDDELPEDDDGNEIDEDDERDRYEDEGCIADPCLSSDSINIKIIDWQERSQTPEAALPLTTLEPLSPDDYSCDDFESQAEAQEFYESSGGPTIDVYELDPDRNGIACEDLPVG